MQKKKSLIIFLVIIFVILIVGGVATYIFTDLFKSDKQLFYKYLLDENEMFTILNEAKIEENSNSYTANTNVESIYEYDNRIEELEKDQIIKNLQDGIKSFEYVKNLNATVESRVDKTNKNQYHNIQLKKNDNQIMKFEAVRNKDKYAVKVEDILNAYIGMENGNMKDLASKFGVSNAESFPDKIDYENKKYKELFEISKEEKEHIKTMYKDLLYKEIDKANYTREKNCIIKIQDKEYEANQNTLRLNKEQSINIGIKILENLKEDSITLNLISNKIKTLDPNSEYASIDKINEAIQKYIEELQKQEKNSNEYIKIEIYDYKGKTIRLNLYIKEEKKLQLDYINENGEEKLYINQLFTKNESGAIIYDIKTSLLGANNITITKSNNNLKIDVWLYDIKEIYKTIIDEMNSRYEEQKNNTQSNEEGTTNVTQDEINELQKIYKQYETTDQKLLKLGFTIEIEKSESDKQISLYANICNSKIGAKLNTQKKYTDDVGEITIIDEKNSLFLNKYPKEQIEGIVKLISTKTIDTIKQRIQ